MLHDSCQRCRCVRCHHVAVDYDRAEGSLGSFWCRTRQRDGLKPVTKHHAVLTHLLGSGSPDSHAYFLADACGCVVVGMLSASFAGGSAALLPKYTAELQPPDLPAEQQAAVQAAPDVDVDLVNALLRPLEGQRLNYYAFARDTPKGKDCECTLLVARASLVMIPIPQQASWSQEQAHDTKQHQQQHWQLQQPQHQQAAAAGRHGSRVDSPVSHARCPCLAVELVGDRFLRRMVRVLVGTLVREAVAITQAQHGGSNRSESHERLLHLLQGMDRTATAGSAPALGLCFAAVGYD